ETSQLTCSLWEIRCKRRLVRFRPRRAISQKTTTTATATARLGSCRMIARAHPTSLLTRRFQALPICMRKNVAICVPASVLDVLSTPPPTQSDPQTPPEGAAAPETPGAADPRGGLPGLRRCRARV